MEWDPAWFSLRLKELREQSGLTQKGLAEKVSLAVRAVTYYESGERLPTWDVVLALAKALGVDCTAFTQPPAERKPEGPGRPAKHKDETVEVPPKKRGRPKKGNKE